MEFYSGCAKPKLHYVFEAIMAWLRFKILFMTFSAERQHQHPKQLMNHCYTHYTQTAMAYWLRDRVAVVMEAMQGRGDCITFRLAHRESSRLKNESNQQRINTEQNNTLWTSCPHLVLQSDAEQKANQSARFCKAKRSNAKQYKAMQAIQRNAKQRNADQSNAKRCKTNQHITVAILVECGRLLAAPSMWELLRVACGSFSL